MGIGDVSEDGHVDLVVSNPGASSVGVMLGLGDGTFGAKTDYETGDLRSLGGARRP